MKLYELNQNYMNLLELLESGQVEKELLEDAFAEVEGEIEDKLQNIVKIIKSLQADKDAIATERSRLQAREKSLNNNIENLKAYAEMSLRACKKDKIKTELFTLSIRKNPPKVIVERLEDIPKDIYQECVTITEEYDLDKKKLLKIMKDEGLKELDGIKIVQDESLSIR